MVPIRRVKPRTLRTKHTTNEVLDLRPAALAGACATPINLILLPSFFCQSALGDAPNMMTIGKSPPASFLGACGILQL